MVQQETSNNQSKLSNDGNDNQTNPSQTPQTPPTPDSSTSYLLTADMEASLWYDNNAMSTNAKIVEQFNGVISRDNLKTLTEYVVDSSQVIPSANKLLAIKPPLKQRGNVPVESVNNANATPAQANVDETHWNRTQWNDGGYKFTTDENKLTTIIEKRLENDLGQQSEEGNRVFRSNVYVSMDVDAALALQNKSRVCKTGEVILESEYAYSTPKVDYTKDSKASIMIIDHHDYDNSSVRFYLSQQVPECVVTISETNAYDVIAAIGRYVRSLDTLIDVGTQQHERYFILLSNATNPLRCSRCVVNINGNIIGDNFTKFRFGDIKQIAAATGKALNYIQNYTQSVYNILEIDNNNTTVNMGFKTYAADVNTTYTTYNGWNSLTGTTVTWPLVDGTLPLSRQKWNIQDYYTAIHYLVEYHYKISTPYDYYVSPNPKKFADWSLLYYTSNNYGASTIPVSDYLLRVALDKKMCSALNNHTHCVEHRGILGNKLHTLANYRAGRLLACISETFGSLFNLTKLTDLGIVTIYNQLLDAQTIGIYGDDHLIGMISHVKYSPTSPDFVANNPLATTLWNFQPPLNPDPTNGDLLVEEYYPLACYWRSDAFGLPSSDDLDYKVQSFGAGISIGWKDGVKGVTYYTKDGIVGKATYQFDTTVDPISANVYYRSRFGFANGFKNYGSGMYQVPSLFLISDYFFDYKERPNIDGYNNWVYPICYGDRIYATKLNQNIGTDLVSKLFG